MDTIIARRFSALYVTGGLPAKHSCARLHGHNCDVVLQSAGLDPVGFMRDYRKLSELTAFIDKPLDRRHFSDVLGHDRTTSEVLARGAYDWSRSCWPEVAAGRVGETPKTRAEYRP